MIKLFKGIAAVVVVYSFTAGYLAIGTWVEDGTQCERDCTQANLGRSRMRTLVQSIANDINYSEITVRNLNGTVVLEGVAMDEEQLKDAQAIAESYIRNYYPVVPRKLQVLNLVKPISRHVASTGK